MNDFSIHPAKFRQEIIASMKPLSDDMESEVASSEDDEVLNEPRIRQVRPAKGVLKQPTEKFPEDATPVREGVFPRRHGIRDGNVPPDARWTKISRQLVDPEALEIGKERFEVRDDFVIVLRVLTRDEVHDYAEVTKKIRVAREEGPSDIENPTKMLNFEQVSRNHLGTSNEWISRSFGSRLDTARVSYENDDADSIDSGSSIASFADSIFSFVSGSSMSSIAGPQSAVDRLVALILSDTDVKYLCTEALGIFERERFERNLRRLLKEFAVGLRKEAETVDERHAANFVRIRARNSAYMICSNLDGKKKIPKVVDIDFENISEESDVDGSDEEVDDLQHLEAFVRGSNALNVLRDNLKYFVQSHGIAKANAAQLQIPARSNAREGQASRSSPQSPGPPDKQIRRSESTGENTIEEQMVLEGPLLEPASELLSMSSIDSPYDGYGYVNPREVVRDLHEAAATRSVRRHSIDSGMTTNLWEQKKKAKDDFSISYSQVPKVAQTMVSSSNTVTNVSTEDGVMAESNAFKAPAPEQYGAFRTLKVVPIVVDMICAVMKMKEPKVRTGWTRIQYKCKCGHTMIEDVRELQSGAADRLRESFSGSLLKKADSTSNSTSKAGRFGQVLSALLQISRKLIGTNEDISGDPQLPVHEMRSVGVATGGDNSHPSPAPATPIDLLYLLICYNKSRYEERLLQLDLTDLDGTGDKALFENLRQNYHNLKKWPDRFLSLRSLQSIQFVQFELYKSELVDIRKRNHLPPPEDVEYRYMPAPPETIPPVGNNYLMHVFQNPECADEEPLCLSRFPKKLKERLACQRGIKLGWGLQFVEGWDGKKLWLTGFVFFGLSSLTIGILWAVLKHSIQDAFAVAGYMVALGTMSIGTIQAFLVM
ncbi:hypothetical protein BKA64DRAFT_670366 [Cadophora sp. MPI-SDFR-AT-0126]|nr:hypothetical protein BKA64DRAFT_670366 [Leotiomycetes sp. MPI-SDFR-AT-0126]